MLKVLAIVLSFGAVCFAAQANRPGHTTCFTPGTEYNECASNCPTSCANMGQRQMCILSCTAKCTCMPGLVYDEDMVKCIRPEECPVLNCGKNMTYTSCASMCPITCQNRDTKVICVQGCARKCICKPHYILDELTNTCVKPEDCPPRH